jgi:hypothetical protein
MSSNSGRHRQERLAKRNLSKQRREAEMALQEVEARIGCYSDLHSYHNGLIWKAKELTELYSTLKAEPVPEDAALAVIFRKKLRDANEDALRARKFSDSEAARINNMLAQRAYLLDVLFYNRT